MNKINLIIARHNVNVFASTINSQLIPYNDLTILLKGKLEYVINDKPVTLNEGDVIFIPVGGRRARKTPDAPADYISFNFLCDRKIRLPEYMKDALHSEGRLLLAAFDKINSVTYLDNKEKNVHLLACLISVLEDRVERQRFNPITMQIISYLRTNMNRKVTLEDISKLTFFSPIYCDTVFKKDMGYPIIDYLLDMRIDEAKKLLREGTLNYQEISESVGFNDYNYFSRVFKARSGCSPRAYKKMMYEDNL